MQHIRMLKSETSDVDYLRVPRPQCFHGQDRLLPPGFVCNAGFEGAPVSDA